jgi:hypothetical protein
VSKSAGVPLGLTSADVCRWKALVLPTADCWVWMGAVGGDGYGRFALRRGGRQRTVTPHQVAATLSAGTIPAGATLMHDCDLRLCVRVGPGHLRVATQRENLRQAAQRGRLHGPRPGMVDIRGSAGASRAVQQAMRSSPDRSSAGLALALRAAVAAGHPLRDNLVLFDCDYQPVGAVSTGCAEREADSPPRIVC